MVFSLKVVRILENIFPTVCTLKLKEIIQVCSIPIGIFLPSNYFDEFSKGFIIEEVNDYSEKVFWWSPTFSIIKNCWEKIDGQHQLMLVMP